MAPFFLVSGYLFMRSLDKYQTHGAWLFITGKFRVLMIPYICYSIVTYCTLFIAQYAYPPILSLMESTGKIAEFSLPLVAFQILTNQGHVDFHLWYVYSLFIVFSLSFFGRKHYNKLIWIICAIGMFYLSYLVQLPQIIQMTSRYIFFFCLGGKTALVDFILARKNWFPPLLLVVAVYGVFYMQIQQILPKPILVTAILLIALLATAMFLTIAEAISGRKAGSVFKLLGDYSYDIYLMHQPYIVAALSTFLLLMTDLPHVVIAIISTFLGLIIPIIVSKYILRRISVLRMLFLGNH